MLAPAESRKWLLIASYASVGVAIFLIVLKSAAWIYTGSASLLGSLLDSVMDSMASLVTVLAIHYSLKPADEEHRFGHGKAESLAALVQAGFILGSAGLLLLYCIQKLMRPTGHAVENAGIGLAVTVCAIVLTIGLVLLQSYVVRLTHSTAISADRLHYKSDLLMNLGVIVALVFAQRGFALGDVILGLLIALFISHGALRIGWDAFGMLMDRELPPEVDNAIFELAMAHSGVTGVHGLRTRRSGIRYVIQLHIEMPDDIPLLHAHRIADEVEAALLEKFPGADIIIHQDPHSVIEEEAKLASGADQQAC
ncbi:MAG: cation diffusion facilitator family transporter [Pseudomonadales bacterium]|nr:cation diffusion facilitator family transporter [Pseudomonadales bacterium]